MVSTLNFAFLLLGVIVIISPTVKACCPTCGGCSSCGSKARTKEFLATATVYPPGEDCFPDEGAQQIAAPQSAASLNAPVEYPELEMRSPLAGALAATYDGGLERKASTNARGRTRWKQDAISTAAAAAQGKMDAKEAVMRNKRTSMLARGQRALQDKAMQMSSYMV